MSVVGRNSFGSSPDNPLHDARGAVLVIDDSDSARATMVSLLTEAGYAVFELASAIGATRTILRNKVRAVIVDISMPGLSGDKLVGVLRKNASLQQLVVIVVSTDETLLKRASGDPLVDAVLSKSHVPIRLVGLVQRLLAAVRKESVSEDMG